VQFSGTNYNFLQAQDIFSNKDSIQSSVASSNNQYDFKVLSEEYEVNLDPPNNTDPDPRNLHRIMREIEIYNIIKSYQDAEKVNVLFLIDSTNSMKSYLVEVKKSIKNIAKDLKASHPGLGMHLSIVCYRDYGCFPRFEILPFTPSIQEFESFLDKVVTIISKDTAEDVLGGLFHAAQQEWNINDSCTRVMIHIGDAPCHGNFYHKIKSDEYPDGDPYGLCSRSILTRIRQLGIAYIFGRINKSTDLMIRRFDTELGKGYIQVTDMSKPSLLTDVSIDSISRSINKTTTDLIEKGTSSSNAGEMVKSGVENGNKCMSKVGGSRVRYRVRAAIPSTITVIPTEPNWNRIFQQSANLYSLKPVSSIREVLRPEHPWWSTCVQRANQPEGFRNLLLAKKLCKGSIIIKIAPQPFAEGMSRSSRFAKISCQMDWKPAVLKEIRNVTDRNDRDNPLSPLELPCCNPHHVDGPERAGGIDFGGDGDEAEQRMKCGYFRGGYTVSHRVLDKYLCQMEQSSIANFLSREYNRIRPPHCEPVSFIRSHVIETNAQTAFSLFGVPPKKVYYGLEVQLPTEKTPFTRYTNNVSLSLKFFVSCI